MATAVKNGKPNVVNVKTKRLPPATDGVQNARFTQQIIENTTFLIRRQLGVLMDGERRNIDDECQYPQDVTTDLCQQYYKREGVARRVVDVWPDECFVSDPDIYESEDPEDTDFEKAWKTLNELRNVVHYMHRVDRMSGIGTFGILLLGIGDGKDLDKPAKLVNPEVNGSAKEMPLLYLRAFDESVVTVESLEEDKTNPRYGLPTFYTINFQEADDTGTGGVVPTFTGSNRVHWTRVVHIADERLRSELYGTRRMEAVYNRLQDVRKLLGGSAEMFWKGAFPGFSFELSPEAAAAGGELDEEAKTSVRNEFQAYMDGLQRYMAIRGLTAKPLAPQVADPVGHLESQLKAIAISLKIPFRVLFGSEQAQLASEQDTRRWNGRVKNRQDKYLTPMLVRAVIDRLILLGCLPMPEKGIRAYIVEWPDLGALSDLEQADLATKRTQALSNWVAGDVGQVIPAEVFLMHVMGFDMKTVKAIKDELRKRMQEEEAGTGDGLGDIGTGEEGGSGEPQLGAGAGAAAGGENVQATGLNGAQISSLNDIVIKVTTKELPPDAAKVILKISFPLVTEKQINQMIDAASKFEPPPPPEPPPGAFGGGGGKPFGGGGGKPPFGGPPKAGAKPGAKPPPFTKNVAAEPAVVKGTLVYCEVSNAAQLEVGQEYTEPDALKASLDDGELHNLVIEDQLGLGRMLGHHGQVVYPFGTKLRITKRTQKMVYGVIE